MKKSVFALILLSLLGIVGCAEVADQPSRTLHFAPHVSKTTAFRLSAEQRIEVYLTPGQDLAYLVNNSIVCRTAEEVIEVCPDLQKVSALTVHVNYLSTKQMLMAAVQPLLDIGLNVRYVTSVTNSGSEPFVYELR